MKLKLTQLEKIFLIVWTCIHCLALFINLADLDYSIITNKPTAIRLDSLKLKSNDINRFVHTEYKYYILTSDQTSRSSFWPLTLFNNDSSAGIYADENLVDKIEFLGIFNGYNYFSFVCYMIMGFSILFIRKVW